MKLRLALLATLVALTPSLAAATPDPLEGRWRKKSMEIEIRPCGEALCGVVTDASESQQSKAWKGSRTKLMGARILTNIRPGDAPGTYRGRLFAPDRDIRVSGEITMVSPDRLSVRGCALLGIVCREREWIRTSR
ncbi:DUF2147 domain-containing protein [Sphingomicrobium nitratireducens]|uniref:DUF2147 domain-containing protein n=1 Tax=Sphingomicrobium nitratireducens TaxID=2964666 RepID=UPI002240C70D|nr:DUF2147 domain-containing protein [Sphingomicrobium nitratireducens]